MSKKIHILLLLGIIALINACLYTEAGIYEVEPIPDDPPVISVTTNLDTMNNPRLTDSLEVVYDIVIQNGDLYYVDALVGNLPVYDSDTSNGSFWLYPYHVQFPGVDTLYIDIFYSSNTNSLGDIAGVEALDVNLKYAIYFDWEPI